jgi:hypothetical protein
MVDENAFADRLYADALAFHLRLRDTSLAGTEFSWDKTEGYLRDRMDVYRRELSTTAAVAERALEEVKEHWRRLGIEVKQERVVMLLLNVARRLLKTDGPEMILCVDRLYPGREILRWRYVSLALPPGILVAAATPPGAPPPATVRLLHASMAPDGPVAHQHVHHAAMMSFEELWASLRLRALLRPPDFLASLHENRAVCPQFLSAAGEDGTAGGEPVDARQRLLEHARHIRKMTAWGEYITQAFIARRVLDVHVDHIGPLSRCNHPICEVGRTSLRSFTAGRIKPKRATVTPYPWTQERYGLQRRVRQAAASSKTGRAGRQQHNLLLRLAADERDILVRAFGYLSARAPEPTDADGAGSGTPDDLFERLFLQYLRIKTTLFGLLVHSPGERGLENFIGHFKQVKVYAPGSGFLRPGEFSEPGLDVKATERRVAPDDWPEACTRRDREDDANLPSGQSPSEKAWLIHFQRAKATKGVLPLYGAEIRELDSSGRKVVRALAAQPTRLNSLRGIDIAGLEGDQPLWVSAETLRSVRRSSSEIAGRRPGLKLQPLRLTLHAGEDFRWLTSGVRAVAEPFHWNLIERGDRIGHGIAVTLNPKHWWERNNGHVIPVKRVNRLLDLAFLAQYTEGDRCREQDAWLLEQIRNTFAGFGLERTQDNADSKDTDVVEMAVKVWSALGGRTMRRLASRRRYSGDLEPHERWIQRYLWNPSTQDLADEVLRLQVDNDRGALRITSTHTECDLLVKARKRLIREMARWQVCIESNPSSNLVVAGLESMGAAQDFLQRRPTRNEAEELETLPWSISTDDPVTFSTSLTDEYAYAWAGMVLRTGKPYDPSYARALLDEAAATSMRTRFTVPREDLNRSAKATRKRRG